MGQKFCEILKETVSRLSFWGLLLAKILILGLGVRLPYPLLCKVSKLKIWLGGIRKLS